MPTDPTPVVAALRQALEAYEAAANGRDEARAIGGLMTAANPSAIRTLLDAFDAARAENERMRKKLDALDNLPAEDFFGR